MNPFLWLLQIVFLVTINGPINPSRPISSCDLSKLAIRLEPPARQASAWRVGQRVIAEYVYYSACFKGQPVTTLLLSADHEAVITRLGLSDTDAYEMTVEIERYEFDRHGRLMRGPIMRGPMTKADFDRLEPPHQPVPVPRLLPPPMLYPELLDHDPPAAR